LTRLVLQDYIFINDGFKALAYGVIDDKCPSGRNPSDHKPVVADLELLK
jgi:endonuclease/exonuclease/phosphatase family metal-dependent hydrolase